MWVPQPVKNDGEWTRRAEGKRSSAEVRAMNTGLMRKLFSSPRLLPHEAGPREVRWLLQSLSYPYFGGLTATLFLLTLFLGNS